MFGSKCGVNWKARLGSKMKFRVYSKGRVMVSWTVNPQGTLAAADSGLRA